MTRRRDGAASVCGDLLLKHVLCVCFQDGAETLSQSFIDHMLAWTGNTIQTRFLSAGPGPCERAPVQHLLTEVFLSFITNRRHSSRHRRVSAALQLIPGQTPTPTTSQALLYSQLFKAIPYFPHRSWCAFRQTPSPSVRRLHGSIHEIFKVQ